MRDELWEMAVERARKGTVTQVWTARCPQGYEFRTHGDPDRRLVDMEGIALVRRKRKDKPAPESKEQP